MSGLNSPFYRALTVANGSVRKTGVSKNLGKGELALVDVKDTTKVGGNIGARVLTSLAGKVKDDKRFQIIKSDFRNIKSECYTYILFE